MPHRIELLDVPVNTPTLEEAVDAIVEAARGESLSQFAFVNADCLNLAWTQSDYRKLLQKVPWVLPDGSGVRYAGRALGTPVRDNVNGTDLYPLLCERARAEGLPLYFLGGRPGVSARVVERSRKRYPGLPVAGHEHGFFGPDEEDAVVNRIRASGARILLVALGAPRQDLWIDANRDALGVGAALGVGGLFDFVSRGIPRAPLWLRQLGFEWVYRLYQEPLRLLHRYLVGNPRFLWRVLRWRRGARPTDG